jgi:hypothetical protein
LKLPLKFSVVPVDGNVQVPAGHANETADVVSIWLVRDAQPPSVRCTKCPVPIWKQLRPRLTAAERHGERDPGA